MDYCPALLSFLALKCSWWVAPNMGLWLSCVEVKPRMVPSLPSYQSLRGHMKMYLKWQNNFDLIVDTPQCTSEISYGTTLHEWKYHMEPICTSGNIIWIHISTSGLWIHTPLSTLYLTSSKLEEREVWGGEHWAKGSTGFDFFHILPSARGVYMIHQSALVKIWIHAFTPAELCIY